jgi:Asp-tRNA(Asn)/Glu-tRNA(Gln) amidotransferase A subunit family amidase
MPALTERSAVALGDAIRRREVTASDVMEAHLEVLERAGAKLNAVVADRFAEARAEAQAIDQRIAGSAIRGQTLELPPLLGVPFTVK